MKTFKINKKTISAAIISVAILVYAAAFLYEKAMDILENAGLHFVVHTVEETIGLPPSDAKGQDNLFLELIGFVSGQKIAGAQDVLMSVSGNFSNPSALPVVSTTPITDPIASPSHVQSTTTAPPPPTEQTIPSTSGNTAVGGIISIANQTDLTIDHDYLTSASPPFKVGKKAKVLIIHTHTTESYSPSDTYNIVHTEKERTTDQKLNVVKVGDVLAQMLEKGNVSVIHDKTIHDYPSYNASYNNSYETVSKILKQNPSIQIVLDLHRDAIYDKSGNKIKLLTEINGEKAAQVMSVIGTNELGFKHDNWQHNLKFAYLLQQQFLAIDKNFARPINVRSARFNEHLAPGAIILEVGSSGNTLDEALVSAKYIAKALVAVLPKLK